MMGKIFSLFKCEKEKKETTKHSPAKRMLALALSLALAVTFAACGAANNTGGSGTAAEDGVLRVALPADIVTLDAHLTTNDYLVPMNVFDTLLSVEREKDGSTKLVENLADSYDISDDGLTYNFTLKDGIVFSDGTPLTADDVKFTFERILTLPESEQTDFVIAIDGAQELLDGAATELRGITVADETHFTITLAEPFAGFLAQLATPSTVIYSKKIVTEAGTDFGTVCEKTLGTGAYIIKEWERGKSLTFEYNPKYWGKEPSAKKVVVTVMDPTTMNMAFQKGDLDILDCIYLDSSVVESTYKTDAYKDKLEIIDRVGLNALSLNAAVKPLDDVKVRQAIQIAIDRQSILDSIYGGDGKLEDGIYPTGCIDYFTENQGWLKYDPDAAKKLLAEAGYADGFDLELTLDSNAGSQGENTIQIIAENLSKVGINATISKCDHATYLDKRNSGNITAYVPMWLLDFNDPDNIIYTFFGSKENTKIRCNSYSNDEVIDRVAAARYIVDPEKRADEYKALEKQIVREDAAWVPLYSLKHLFVKGDRVASFEPQWAGWSDMNFKDVVLQ